MTRTYTPRASEIDRRWFVVDADGVTLGRLASQVAHLLEGKHKPTFATHLDTGDHVIVLNAAKVAVSASKLDVKMYARHSGYPGGFRQESLQGHAPADQARRAAAAQAQGLRGSRPPARSPAAAAAPGR
jgi:ribosomal protein L13